VRVVVFFSRFPRLKRPNRLLIKTLLQIRLCWPLTAGPRFSFTAATHGQMAEKIPPSAGFRSIAGFVFRSSFLSLKGLVDCGCTCKSFRDDTEGAAEHICDEKGWPKFDALSFIGTLYGKIPLDRLKQIFGQSNVC
jgi:hypothetical protein